jgi:prepilin-type N-terminal cleavage/methylation domain-containing protein
MNSRHYLERRDRRGFSLAELVVAIVVIGILASLAVMGFRAVVDRSVEAKQQQRMVSLLKEARVLYVQKIYQDPSYTWQKAIIDASADLPSYRTDALSGVAEGTLASGGTNLNTASNGWTLEADTGAAVYSAASSELVFKVSGSTLYIASAVHARRAVFGLVSQDTKPVVWSAECSGSSCDAESATTGVPAGGAYAPGTTASPGPTLLYSNTDFNTDITSEVLSPTSNGATSFSYTGTLPAGVTFNTATGAFTGPTVWSSAETYTSSHSRTGACVLSSLGAVKCWGNNGNGAVGNGSTTGTVNTPYTVIASGVTQLSANDHHACALLSGNVVRCWGWNGYGQLGDGTTTTRATPTAVTGLPADVVQISVGIGHTCARTQQGAAWCWGYNAQGGIGDGTTTQRTVPTQVTGLTTGVTTISAGQWGTCAVQSGAAKCWGYGSGSANGSGSFSNLLVPTQVTGLTTGVTDISRSTNLACAIQNGAVKCWGDNGGVGDGTTTYRTTPVQVTGLTSGVTAISVSFNMCAVHNGAVKCWGYNNANQMGDSSGTFKTTPFQVPGLTTGFVSVSAAPNDTSTAIDSQGRLWIWTTGGFGQRGDGTNAGAAAPYMFAAPTVSPVFPATVTVTATGASGSTSTSVTLGTYSNAN